MYSLEGRPASLICLVDGSTGPRRLTGLPVGTLVVAGDIRRTLGVASCARRSSPAGQSDNHNHTKVVTDKHETRSMVGRHGVGSVS